MSNQTFPTWQHQFRATTACPSYGPKHQIRVKAGLHYLQGNTRPYFSVTAEVFRPGARDCDACGQLHDEVLAAWPELAPVVALHLSNDLGEPMHAEANGWYWLAGYLQTDDRYHGGTGSSNKDPEECLQIFADHVRVSIDDARQLAKAWHNSDDWKASRRWFGQWLETQRPRWKQEAEAAIALLDQLIAR